MGEPRVDTNPEGLVHDAIGIGQFPHYAETTTFEIGLAGQVTGEQQTGTNLCIIEEFNQLNTANTCRLFQGNRKTKP